MNTYTVEMKITKPNGEVVTLTTDCSCPECQKAAEQLVEVENKRDKRSLETFKNRMPLMIVVDPDYNNTIHMEVTDQTINEYVEFKMLSEPGRALEEAKKYAKDNMQSYKGGGRRVQFVKDIRSKFLNPDGNPYIGLREAVDIYNSL